MTVDARRHPSGPRRGAVAVRIAVLLLCLGAVQVLSAGDAAPARSTGALAAWVIEPDASTISFDYVLEGKAGTGTFRRFSGTGAFDATDPGAATLEIEIDSASVDFGSGIVNAFATSAEGFDSKTYPEVVYKLTELEPQGDQAYLATGVITIKGRTRPLVSPVTLTIADDHAEATGVLTLDRTDYGLGVGPASALFDIARAVDVRFLLRARPVR